MSKLDIKTKLFLFITKAKIVKYDICDDIKIANVNKSKAGHIDSIKHTISLDIYRKWSRIIIFSNVKKEVSLGKSLPN